ncbi:D-3-phosphoglycerate dehydrogenase domain protein [Rhodococcus sp. MTM3W5.2]|nr:D-3-phosphoglycerate dehydrogenase domain protein [Rhodococcus sp. MTM3W5.2]
MSQPGRPVVLIADKLAPSTVEALGDGVEVRWVDGPDRPALLAAVPRPTRSWSARRPPSTRTSSPRAPS